MTGARFLFPLEFPAALGAKCQSARELWGPCPIIKLPHVANITLHSLMDKSDSDADIQWLERAIERAKSLNEQLQLHIEQLSRIGVESSKDSWGVDSRCDVSEHCAPS